MTHVIPESVRQTWNEWMAYFRKTEIKETGQEHVSDAVEKAGWGVEEAQERHQEEASRSTPCQRSRHSRPMPRYGTNDRTSS
jgi:hypothetical protein